MIYCFINYLRAQQEDDQDLNLSLGSSEATAEVGENLNRNENRGPDGVFGKNSEVTWMHRLGDEMQRRDHSRDETAPLSSNLSITDSLPDAPPESHTRLAGDIPIVIKNYYLDDFNIRPLDHNLDPLAVPPKAFADKYFNEYMNLVHPFFGVVWKSNLTAQYDQIMSHLVVPPRKWLAIQNMIFALGCRHCRLMGSAHSDAFDKDGVF